MGTRLDRNGNHPSEDSDHADVVPIEAEFSVTGVVENGAWGDAAGFESARSLLETRYDLKLGLWDLVRNPVLRATVLESTPVLKPPKVKVAMPLEGTRSGSERAAVKLAEGARRAAALEPIR